MPPDTVFQNSSGDKIEEITSLAQPKKQMKLSDSLQKIISFSQLQSQRVGEAEDSGRKSPSFPSFPSLSGKREAKFKDKIEKRVANLPFNQTSNPLQT